MRDDVASDGLLGVDCVSHAATGVSCHLVGYEDRHVELLTDFLQPAKNPVEHLLPLGQFASTGVVDPERRHNRIDNNQSECVFNHDGRRLLEESDQGIDGMRSTDHDVIQNLLGIQVESLGNALNAFWAEGILGVNEHNLPLTPTLRSGHLSRHAKSVA
jgi:hypothetical protein